MPLWHGRSISSLRMYVYTMYSLLHDYLELYMTTFYYEIIHGRHSKLGDDIYIATVQYFIVNSFELLTI